MSDSMRRRFAYDVNDNYNQIKIDNDVFKGYVVYLKLNNIRKPLIVNNGKEFICIRDNNYEWIEVYPENGKYVITIMFDDNNNNLIEWYFDISKNIGILNGIPYEDDLYLDMIITPSGEEIIIDEDELMSAYNRGDITLDDVSNAYQTLKLLEDKYVNNIQSLVDLTNDLCRCFNKDINIKIM